MCFRCSRAERWLSSSRSATGPLGAVAAACSILLTALAARSKRGRSDGSMSNSSSCCSERLRCLNHRARGVAPAAVHPPMRSHPAGPLLPTRSPAATNPTMHPTSENSTDWATASNLATRGSCSRRSTLTDATVVRRRVVREVATSPADDVTDDVLCFSSEILTLRNQKERRTVRRLKRTSS